MWPHTWVVSSPPLTVLLRLPQATFLFSVVNWSPLRLVKGLVAPAWATALGLILTFSSVSLLPIWALYAFSVTPGTPQQVAPLAFLQRISHTAFESQPIAFHLPQRFQRLCRSSQDLPTANPPAMYSPVLPLTEKQ